MIAQDAVTELVLETFRLNGRLLATGDALIADLGLSSARWQVIGAISLSPVPLPVAHIARNMGLTRQAVQRLANDMERDGLVRFAPNPHHDRAKLVLLTRKGKAAFAAAMERQGPWANSLVAGLSMRDIKLTTLTLRTIRQRLEQQAGADDA
ncbi:MAG: MarR family winged helix-turn-helix transcriptional regulator [Xanthobacteraceae bacterium]